MIVEIVPTDKIDGIWPLVALGFTDCLRKTPTSIGAGDFWTMCRDGSAFLIICHDSEVKAASVWRFEGDKFNCLLMYGKDADTWTHALFDYAASIARMNGSTALMATGRLGLGRMLKRNNVNAKTIRQTYLVEV